MTGRVAHYRVGNHVFGFAADQRAAAAALTDACGDLSTVNRTGVGGLLDVPPGQTSVVEFFARLNPRVVDAHPGWPIFHAGAAELAQGAVIAFGLSGAGKSTLIAALVQLGAGYLTDEASLIDPATGWVHPYAKPLSLSSTSLDLLGVVAGGHQSCRPGRDEPGDPLGEVPLRARDLGGHAVSGPVPLWGLCHVVRAPAGAPRVRQLGPCAALMAMLPSYMCFSPDRNPLVELSQLIGVHPVWEVSGGTPSDAAGTVLGLPAASVPLDPIIPAQLPSVELVADPAPRSPTHLGPFSAPTRQPSLVGVRYPDGAVVLDRRTGEHLEMSPGGFDIVAGLDGGTSLRDVGRLAGCAPSICVEFTRALADRGWLQGYSRRVDLPVHPHVRDRVTA